MLQMHFWSSLDFRYLHLLSTYIQVHLLQCNNFCYVKLHRYITMYTMHIWNQIILAPNSSGRPYWNEYRSERRTSADSVLYFREILNQIIGINFFVKKELIQLIESVMKGMKMLWLLFWMPFLIVNALEANVFILRRKKEMSLDWQGPSSCLFSREEIIISLSIPTC